MKSSRVLLSLFLGGMGCSLSQADLVRHYTFDTDFSDTTGTYHGNLVDVGTTGNSGISTNAGEFIVGSGALDLGADRDYVDIPPQTFSSGSPYSIAFWAKKAATSASWNMVIGQRSGTSFFIALHSTIGIRRRSSDDSAARQSDFAAPDDTEWHHYTITASEDGAVRFYLDGESAGMETNELTGYTYDTIGEAYPDTSDFDFQGQIDDVHVYDEQVESEVVTALYLRGLPRLPVRYYSFDTNYTDQVSTNHGTLVDVDALDNSGITTNAEDRAVGVGALDLSADRDYIAIPSLTFYSGTPYSIAFWAKKAPGDTGDPALWDMVVGQRGGTSFFIGLNNATGLRWRSSDSSTFRQADFTIPDDTTWHHHVITATADGVLSYFLDGALTGSRTNMMTGFILDTIGEAYTTGRDFDFHGQIDEVYVFDRTVSTSVVKALYDARDGGPVEPPDPAGYDVYLIAGQSNADGRGVASELTGELSSWNAAQPDVRIYFVNPFNSTDPTNPDYNTGWTTLAPGWAAPPGFSGALPSGDFGFELSFARTLADLSPDRRVALIKVTKGGTNLHTQWNPGESGNFMWSTFTNFVPHALQTLTNAGDTVTLKGMIWHQGESDSGNGDFEDDLRLFLAATRSFVGDPEFPVALGELERDPADPSRDYQNQAMAAVRDADPFTGLASAEGLPTVDGTHFDTSAVITYGVRYADLIRDVDADGLPDDWERTTLSSLTNSSGSVSDDWDADGSPDYAEFRAGTHPARAEDALRLAVAAIQNHELRWSSITGRVYRVLHRTSWETDWSTFRDNVPATPPENTQVLPALTNRVELYRIELVSP